MRRVKGGTLKALAAAVLMVAVVLLAMPSPSVLSQPTTSQPQPMSPNDIAAKSQQAAQISREIDALDKELEIANESYNRVRDDLNAITEKVDQTRQRLFEIKQDLKKRREILNERAAAMYKNGRTSMLEVILRTKDIADFLERADYVARVAESDSDLIRRIKSTRDSVEELERQYAEQQRVQQGLAEQSAAKKAQIETTLAQRQQLLTTINQEIQQLLEQEARARAAEAAQLEKVAQEVLATAPEDGLARTAMKYLGVPYHWAGEGPGKCPTGEHRICFDCSGLTQYVYKLFGIDMPHNAAMQFNDGIKIPLEQARAGDLVFFGMPPHHVGMYLGNDLFIHAPQTGDIVKVTKLSSRSDFSGVCRFSRDLY